MAYAEDSEWKALVSRMPDFYLYTYVIFGAISILVGLILLGALIRQKRRYKMSNALLIAIFIFQLFFILYFFSSSLISSFEYPDGYNTDVNFCKAEAVYGTMMYYLTCLFKAIYCKHVYYAVKYPYLGVKHNRKHELPLRTRMLRYFLVSCCITGIYIGFMYINLNIQDAATRTCGLAVGESTEWQIMFNLIPLFCYMVVIFTLCYVAKSRKDLTDTRVIMKYCLYLITFLFCGFPFSIVFLISSFTNFGSPSQSLLELALIYSAVILELIFPSLFALLYWLEDIRGADNNVENEENDVLKSRIEVNGSQAYYYQTLLNSFEKEKSMLNKNKETELKKLCALKRTKEEITINLFDILASLKQLHEQSDNRKSLPEEQKNEPFSFEFNHEGVASELNYAINFQFKDYVKCYAPDLFFKIQKDKQVDYEALLKALSPLKNSDTLKKDSECYYGLYYLSENRRFGIQSLERGEKKVLKSILGNYAEYMSSHPHSFLLNILGMFEIKKNAKEKQYYLLVENTHQFNDPFIESMYDLKGKPNRSALKVVNRDEISHYTVLKDMDFLNLQSYLLLGDADVKEKVMDILREDITFLKGLDLVDYSISVMKSSYENEEEDKKQNVYRRSHRIYQSAEKRALIYYSFGINNFFTRGDNHSQSRDDSARCYTVLDVSNSGIYGDRFISFVDGLLKVTNNSGAIN